METGEDIQLQKYGYVNERLLEKGWFKKYLLKKAFSIAKNYKKTNNQGLIYRFELFITDLHCFNYVYLYLNKSPGATANKGVLSIFPYTSTHK
jgi:hypothetical protein